MLRRWIGMRGEDEVEERLEELCEGTILSDSSAVEAWDEDN